MSNVTYEVEIPVGICKIKIQSEDLESLIEAFKNFNEKIFEDMELLSKAQSVTKSFYNKEPETLTLPMSEFLKQFKSDTDKILACIYYLLKYKGIKLVNAKNISDLLTDARVNIPENINAFLNSLSSRKLVAESDRKVDNLKTWFITLEGEELLEKLIPIK